MMMRVMPNERFTAPRLNVIYGPGARQGMNNTVIFIALRGNQPFLFHTDNVKEAIFTLQEPEYGQTVVFQSELAVTK